MENRVTLDLVRLLLLLWALTTSSADTSTILRMMTRRQITIPVCSTPAAPDNGFRIGDTFYPGHSVRFSCRNGYRLVGSEVLTCRFSTYDLDWDAEIPLCATGERGMLHARNIILSNANWYIHYNNIIHGELTKP